MRQNFQTQHFTKLENYNWEEKTQKTSNVTKLRMWQNSRTQKHKMWQNTKTKNVANLKNLKCEEKLRMWHTSTTQMWQN